MGQSSTVEGSGGYHRPWAAAALLTSALIAPAPAMATPWAGSTVISVSFSSDNTMLGVCEELPPERLEPSPRMMTGAPFSRSEEHTSELQSRGHLVCRLLLEKKKKNKIDNQHRRKDKYSTTTQRQ